LKEKKTILLIIPNLNFGGAQTSFSNLSLILAKRYEVIPVVFNKFNIAPLELGGTLVDLEITAGRSVLEKIQNFCKRVLKIRKIKKQYNVEVSISFLEGADYVNILSRRNERVIVSVRGSKRNDQNITGWLGIIRHRVLIPWLYKKADAIVSVNQGIDEELRKFYGIKRTEIIPNFYSFEIIRQLAAEPVEKELLDFFRQNMVIVLSGRLTQEKGFDRFIYVFAELKKRMVSLRLLILGDGKDKDAIVKEIKACELTYSESLIPSIDVLLLGYQANPHKFISKSKVFVLPSLHEGFPNALVEAMTIGVPVVAADCPYGPAEILQDGDQRFGLLLPVLKGRKEQKYWFENLLPFLSDVELMKKFSVSALQRVEAFSADNASEKWTDLIERND
jgi:glycosyltransferase involved in cell wall biosynthesis